MVTSQTRRNGPYLLTYLLTGLISSLSVYTVLISVHTLLFISPAVQYCLHVAYIFSCKIFLILILNSLSYLTLSSVLKHLTLLSEPGITLSSPNFSLSRHSMFHYGRYRRLPDCISVQSHTNCRLGTKLCLFVLFCFFTL